MHLSSAHRRVWAIAFPLILSGFSTPLLGLTDIAVLGRLPEVAFLAAANVGAAALAFLYLAFGFLRMSTTTLCAQFYGANDKLGLSTILMQSFLMAWLCAIALVSLQVPIVSFTRWLFMPDANLVPAVEDYLYIRLWSAPATLTHYVMWGLFLGVNRATYPLILVVFINVLNMILDVTLVFGMGLNVVGVALASVIAEYAGLGLGFVLLKRVYAGEGLRWKLSQLIPRRVLFKIASMNWSLFLRTLLLVSVFTFFTAQSTRLGTVPVAANTILIEVVLVFAFFYDGVAYALETLCAQAMGKNSLKHLAEYMYVGQLWGWISAAAFSIIFALGGPYIIAFLTTIPEVRDFAGMYLHWLYLFPLLAVLSYYYDGVFIGLMKFREMLNCMVFSIFVAYGAYSVLESWGNDRLWASLSVFMLVRSVSMMISFSRMRQRKLLFSTRFATR